MVPESGKKAEVLQLIADKEKLELKISQLGNVLNANGIGMSDPLTINGFPRNDIDVYQVRHARHDIICLQNDLKQLMKKIEVGLEMVHAESKNCTSGVTTTRKFAEDNNEKDEAMEITMAPQIPFVKVNLVSPLSPAEVAGLQLDDEIIEFGTIKKENFRDVLQVGELVKHRENNEIQLQVKRGARIMNLTLVPKKWSGRGLLGCNIVCIN